MSQSKTSITWKAVAAALFTLIGAAGGFVGKARWERGDQDHDKITKLEAMEPRIANIEETVGEIRADVRIIRDQLPRSNNFNRYGGRADYVAPVPDALAKAPENKSNRKEVYGP